MEDSDLVSVIIVNWNGMNYLDNCLKSVRNQNYKPIEIIIVDNGSKDGSLDFVKKNYPEVNIIANDVNRGFAGGNNDGIKRAKGEFIALLNNDTVAHPDWLLHLVRIIRSSPRIAGVCGKIYSLEVPDRVLFTLPKLNPYTASALWVTINPGVHKVDYLSGNAMMVRRSVIDEIGEMDEEYFAYYEETDWCARMIRAGYELLYVPDAVIWHKQFGSSSGKFQFYQMERNRIRFALKNFDLYYLIIFVVFYPFDFFPRLIYFLLTSRLEEAWLLTKALFWNALSLRKTFQARRRDFKKIKMPGSYNRNLPLKTLKKYHADLS